MKILDRISFPESLEYFAIRFQDDGGGYKALPSALSPTSRLVRVMKKYLEALPHLQTLVLTEALEIPIEQFVDGELDAFIFYMALSAKKLEESAPEKMSELCEKRGVELIVQHATCTPVFDRYFSRYAEPKCEPDPEAQYERDPLGLRPGSKFGSFFGVERTLTFASLLSNTARFR